MMRYSLKQWSDKFLPENSFLTLREIAICVDEDDRFTLNSYNSAIESGMENIPFSQAEDLIAYDPSLVYVEDLLEGQHL